MGRCAGSAAALGQCAWLLWSAECCPRPLQSLSIDQPLGSRAGVSLDPRACGLRLLVWIQRLLCRPLSWRRTRLPSDSSSPDVHGVGCGVLRSTWGSWFAASPWHMVGCFRCPPACAEGLSLYPGCLLACPGDGRSGWSAHWMWSAALPAGPCDHSEALGPAPSLLPSCPLHC